jgi:tetratricopeptide (TPR) repeat protein
MSIKSKFFYKWGENAFKDNNSELALTMFDKAINADSKELKAYTGKFGIFTRAGRPVEALEVLDYAIEANPENAKNIDELRQPFIKYIIDINMGKAVAVEYCKKGMIQLTQYQQPKEAIKMFNKALEIDPQFIVAYVSISEDLVKIGDIVEAIQMADKALEIDAQYARAYYTKSIGLKMLGKYDEAQMMLDKACEIDPELAKS